jgi:hypothetical protein
MRFAHVAVATAVVLALAACAPATDRASLIDRGDVLVDHLRGIPGVLDAVVRDEKPGQNGVPMFVRLDYDLGEEGVIDTMVAVRNAMDGSDFELFSLEAQIDDSQALPYGASIYWIGLPKEAKLRDDAAVWFDLVESTPLLGLTAQVRDDSYSGSEMLVQYSRAVTESGTLATEDEVEDAMTAAWVAAGRDAETLAVIS